MYDDNRKKRSILIISLNKLTRLSNSEQNRMVLTGGGAVHRFGTQGGAGEGLRSHPAPASDLYIYTGKIVYLICGLIHPLQGPSELVGQWHR